MIPRVTVLMTVYNGGSYLSQAIESVLHQTFKEFEFLIVDDASTDDSMVCIRRYGDPRIRLVRNERNLGQARSLNLGLELARAPYVARLDQDDVCLPDRLREQVAWLEARPDAAVVGSWVYSISAEGRKTGIIGMRVDDEGTFLGGLLTFASPVIHPTVMFRREVVFGLGGYDESFAPCEDYALWCRLALHRFYAVTIPHPLVMVRVHEQQQSQSRGLLQQQQARRAHEQLVADVCGADEARLVSALLRMEESFWETANSNQHVSAALRALERMLTAMDQRLRLSPQASATLKHRVYWWFGHEACLAILQQHRQSLPVYGFAWRGGLRMIRYPAILTYPVGFLLSPFFVPKVRGAFLSCVTRLGKQRYAARLLVNDILQRIAQRRLQPKGVP